MSSTDGPTAQGTPNQGGRELPLARKHRSQTGWTLWVSGTGRLWASRRDALTAAEIAAGCVAFLHADSPGALAGQLCTQEARQDGAGVGRSHFEAAGTAGRASPSKVTVS
jgi:hypothetical protein